MDKDLYDMSMAALRQGALSQAKALGSTSEQDDND